MRAGETGGITRAPAHWELTVQSAGDKVSSHQAREEWAGSLRSQCQAKAIRLRWAEIPGGRKSGGRHPVLPQGPQHLPAPISSFHLESPWPLLGSQLGPQFPFHK